MDAERILGSLVGAALGGGYGRRRHRHRHGGMGSLIPRGALGLGALGVAIAAFEHFSQQQKTPGAQSFGGPPPPSPPPPPPPPGSAARAAAPPPPPPPPPAATPAATTSAAGEEALLMVRAMIAAANADHELDADERQRIVSAVEGSGLGEADRTLLLDELERPMDVATLAAKATTPALKRDVYLASEMAIDADTRAEQNYLARLAKQLGLDDAMVAELKKILIDDGGGAPV